MRQLNSHSLTTLYTKCVALDLHDAAVTFNCITVKLYMLLYSDQ